ncbi:MAG: hypothetical protein GY765_43900 [bacterium]|nr:hypothetical protein [bacterium]
MSEHLMNGTYDEIDFSLIEQESAEMAANLRAIIDGLELAGNETAADLEDIPITTAHLDHIAKTTEKGVLEVMNTSESIMAELYKVKDSLDKIAEQCPENEVVREEAKTASDILDGAQNQCFSIMTSLEFDDIHRQLLEKIITRLEQSYEKLMELQLVLNLRSNLEKQEDEFLKGLQRIIDIEGTSKRHSQDVVDDILDGFEEF